MVRALCAAEIETFKSPAQTWKSESVWWHLMPQYWGWSWTDPYWPPIYQNNELPVPREALLQGTVVTSNGEIHLASCLGFCMCAHSCTLMQMHIPYAHITHHPPILETPILSFYHNICLSVYCGGFIMLHFIEFYICHDVFTQYKLFIQ